MSGEANRWKIDAQITPAWESPFSSCNAASSLGGYQVSTLSEDGKISSILSVMRIEPKVDRFTLKGNKESPEGAGQEHNP